MTGKTFDLSSILEDIISRDYEEDWFEFKENWYEPHALGEYISGMSNAAAMAGQDYAFLSGESKMTLMKWLERVSIFIKM